MDWLQASILGIVEGLTEFLPISSTGHLILVSRWLGRQSAFVDMFNIVIQFGAMLALPFVFGRRLLCLETAPSWKGLWNLWSRVAVAILPALVLGLLLADIIEFYLFHPFPVAVALAVGGLGLLLLDRSERTGWGWEGLDYRRALLIGLFQCLALWPGVSRSAATILGALLIGANRRLAAEFSFYLAFPILGLASAYSLFKFIRSDSDLASIGGSDWAALGIGFVVSALVAFAVSKWFLAFISRHDFRPFGWYRMALAALVLASLAFG